jgi:hypothetical protein
VIRHGGEAKIDCHLGIFAAHEQEIGRLTETLNRAATAPAKADGARQLQDATQVLLSCVGYQEDNASCRLCREFSRLRNQTAALITKAVGLAG